MRRVLPLLCILLLAGCAAAPTATQPPAPPVQVDSPVPSQADPPIPTSGRPQRHPDRDQLRDELIRLMNEEEGPPQEKLNRAAGRVYREDEVPWLEADLNGDGTSEFVLVRAVENADQRVLTGQGAALFVIYRQAGVWAVDRTDPMDPRMEADLMAPHLHAVADLVGSGIPQIIWYRPEVIATGPQPHFVFVTAWEPGRFTHVPGRIALSNSRLALEGRDLLLTGISRNNTYLPVMERTDGYRLVDGAFQLVDRQFNEHPEDGYARLWDALVAEDSGRVADAETAYREVMDPARPAHSGGIRRYNQAPRQLSETELQLFGEALRTFARFRLGVLLLQEAQAEEAVAVMEPGGGVYDGLLDAARHATDRGAACDAAQLWAATAPEFLQALNLGVGTRPWIPAILCSHVDIDDHGIWER